MGEIQDEHAGKGGSYLLVDGKRVLQERTDHAPQQTEPVAVAAPAKNKSTKREGSK